jgi:hypothetical protein
MDRTTVNTEYENILNFLVKIMLWMLGMFSHSSLFYFVHENNLKHNKY